MTAKPALAATAAPRMPNGGTRIARRIATTRAPQAADTDRARAYAGGEIVRRQAPRTQRHHAWKEHEGRHEDPGELGAEDGRREGGGHREGACKPARQEEADGDLAAEHGEIGRRGRRGRQYAAQLGLAHDQGDLGQRARD